MPPGMQMKKVPEYPRPHNWEYNFMLRVEGTAANNSTICPIITYDEGLGAMSAYESNPTNSSFVDANTDHCFPTSRVDSVYSKLTVQMNKIMLETDKVHAVKFATATIHSSFNETGLAADEVSTLDLNEILELQIETTDRQMAPLYNTVDLADFKTNAGLDMPAETAPFLDTDVEIEGVVFTEKNYYDCLQFFTNGPKLRATCTPLKWHTLTKQHPVKEVYTFQQSNTKYLNPFTFLGTLVHVPSNISMDQYGKPGDTTVDTCGLEFAFRTRYLEHNHEFNHSML